MGVGELILSPSVNTSLVTLIGGLGTLHLGTAHRSPESLVTQLVDFYMSFEDTWGPWRLSFSVSIPDLMRFIVSALHC